MDEHSLSMTNDTLLEDAVNDVVKETPQAKFNLKQLVDETSKKFIQNKLADFPRMCDVFRFMNKTKMDEMVKNNISGWSEKKNFKWDFDIPTELYYFMVNLVYRDFWGEDNEKIWRPFLKAIMRGDDSCETLMKVKAIYGSTQTAEKAGIL